MAWGFGWEPAQKIAGRDWLYPYLIYCLSDPYAAVRFDAWKSLQTLPGFSGFSFTYAAADDVLARQPRAPTKNGWARYAIRTNVINRRPPSTPMVVFSKI